MIKKFLNQNIIGMLASIGLASILIVIPLLIARNFNYKEQITQLEKMISDLSDSELKKSNLRLESELHHSYRNNSRCHNIVESCSDFTNYTYNCKKMYQYYIDNKN